MRYLVFLGLMLMSYTSLAQIQSADVGTEKDTVYNPESVEESAEFPGGMSALSMYLAKNVKYPADAEKSNIQGKAYVEFIIDKTGKVTRVKIKKGVYKSIDEEALRVIEEMPDWKPATIKGRPVNQRFVIPLNFKLP